MHPVFSETNVETIHSGNTFISVQERTDKLIAQALQEKESDIAKHEEQAEFHKLQVYYFFQI